VRENYRRLSSALKRNYDKTRILYAAKANTSLSVLTILRSEGAEADTVSPGEVFLALEAGYKPTQITFTGRYFVPKMVLNGHNFHSRIQRHFRAC